MSDAIETTCDLVRRNSERHAATPFLNFYDAVISYRELEQRTNTFANYLLGKGVGRGDVVSYMLGNSPAVFDVLLGAQRLGAIGSPISCWWQAAEVEYLVFDATGALAFSGATEAVEDGLVEIVLGADRTAELEAGSHRLEVIVAPRVVSIATFGSLEFVAAP